MGSHNPYRDWVYDYAKLLRQGRSIVERPTGVAAGKARADAPKALIFAPHPDDETIIGGLPLRLARELGFRVIDVAVTLGSRLERREGRRQELIDACTYLGFELYIPGGDGFSDINPEARKQLPENWGSAVAILTSLLAAEQPTAIFLPHAEDWNRTHLGVHQLVMEALARQPAAFACQVVETEFWGAMDTPNLLVESSQEDVADLVAALSLHVGEVARNPYHLRLPAWLTDNVRRGGELVGGQGAAVPDFAFATLYRLRRWSHGRVQPVLSGGRALACGDALGELFNTSTPHNSEV